MGERKRKGEKEGDYSAAWELFRASNMRPLNVEMVLSLNTRTLLDEDALRLESHRFFEL